MRALDRKALRDLWHLRGQVIAIGLVIASGVAVLIMSLSTLEALHETSAAYYERYRFADVFARLKRAPEGVTERIARIPGVRTVQTRVVRFAMLDVEGFAEPVMGQLVSIPERGEPLLNGLVLRTGRSVAPGRRDEVVLSEPFAEAHELAPGDSLIAILNGHRRRLRVVGTALSPEFIYSLGPGALMPDDRRFGVMWMGRDALAAAFDLRGSFNDVSLALEPGVRPEPVIQRLDRILERYGGVGAIARRDQISNWFLMNEIDQLATTSRILPAIFLVVAAFLTNMVMARLIATERSQIGLMKAFGYGTREIAVHYAKLVLGIAVVGIGVGIAVGFWFGRLETEMYADSFRFPLLIYRLSPGAFLVAAGLSLLAALAGAARSVARAAAMPPAQAMLPPAPASFRRSRLERTRAGRWVDQPSRIVLRNIARWPGRAAATVLGIACSVAVLVTAFQWEDCLRYLAQSFFYDAQRQHVMVGLVEPEEIGVLHEFEHMPGVMAAEPMRVVAADLSSGPVVHRGAINGVAPGATLQPIYDDLRHEVVEVPPDGLVLSRYLARKLSVTIGDTVWVEVLEGRRPEFRVPVVDLMDTYIAMPAFLNVEALNRHLKERPSVQIVSLLVDSLEAPKLFAELKDVPEVSAVILRQAAIDAFDEILVEHLMVFITLFTTLACALGFGVAYNSMRIALSERGRELATLRVLGFRKGEIAYILLGEIALLIVVAMPVGCALGYGLSALMANAFNTELFRVPLVIQPSTYGQAVIVALLATAVAGLIVRRRLGRLDLIEVLKTRE